MSALAVRRWPLAVVLLLFLLPRLALLFIREPFFDELYTRWIAAKSFAGIVDALRLDSGPPLYYFVVHLLGGGRLLSLLFSTAGLLAMLRERHLAAAAFIAVFPPAVLASADARAYALCAMCVTFGVLALARERTWTAAAAFVLAAYGHYYGVLFFPLLYKRWRALAVAVVLYIPGFWLALHQPAGAREWMQRFAYPDVLFARPPLALAIVGAILLLAAAIRWNAFAPMTLVPLALAIVLGVYVPMRFEAVIAAPLALWLSVGAPALGRALSSAAAARLTLIPLLVALGLWTTLGILDHAGRPPDDYRAAAAWVARCVPRDEPVVASGYLYLETISVRPATAFPPEQAQHPGWRAVARPGSSIPAGTFVWIGERAAPELQLIRRTRRITPLYINRRAAVVKVN